MPFVISCLYESIYVYLSTDLYLCFHVLVRNNSYLYVMYPLLQCTALSSFLKLPTLPLSSCLFSLFFSFVLNCPLLYTSSSSSSLLLFILHFSTHLYCHFPYSSSLHSTLLPQQIQYKGKSTVKYSSYSQGFAFYKSIFSDVRYSTFR